MPDASSGFGAGGGVGAALEVGFIFCSKLGALEDEVFEALDDDDAPHRVSTHESRTAVTGHKTETGKR